MTSLNPFELAHIGTENISSRRRKNIIYSYNLLQLFFMFLIFVLFISEMISGNPVGAIVSLSCSFILAGLYILSRNGYFVLSTFLFSVVMPLVIFGLSIYYVDVKNTSFYFAFFLMISIIFSVSTIRRIGLSIFCLTLAIVSYYYRTKFGTISDLPFDDASNIGLLTAFGLGAFLLCYVLIENASRDEEYIDGILASLKSKNEELEKINERLQHFTQIASHDLKVPLVGVTSLLEIAEKKIANKDYDRVPELLDTIKGSTNQMSNMIKETLEYGKVSNYESIPNTDVDVQKVVDELFADLKYTYPNAKIIHNDLPVIQENEDRVKKVFQNLMQNGLKYNRSEIPTVKIIYTINESGHYISINDNGIGIDPAYIDTIFTPYKRLHGEEEYPGTGLGLSIVKEIVEMSGGTISVDSTIGEGTTFYLTFKN